MRIFNWVHRRFIPKDGIGQNFKKDDQEIISSEADTKALLDLDENMLHYHGWNGGILSIGTFGLLKDDLGIIDNGEYKEYFGFMDKDHQDKWEEEADEEEEESDHDTKGDHDEEEWEDHDENTSTVDGEEYEEDDVDVDVDVDVEGDWNPLLYDRTTTAPRPNAIAMTINAAKLVAPVDPDINAIQSLQYYDNLNKKRERITLADLFSAESSHDGDGTGARHKCSNYCSKLPPNSANKKPATTTAPDGGTKIGILFAKKLIPRVKEDSRPIQKLNVLMKRMLKRKIHPDINVVEGKIKACGGAGNISSAQTDH